MSLSEAVTLSLLFYSLALVGVFASPTVRQRIPRAAITLLIVVPWGVSLLAGALSSSTSESVSMRDSYLELDNVFPVRERERIAANTTWLGYSTRDDPEYASQWKVLYDKFDELPCTARDGRAVGEVWIAPGDACFLATNSVTSAVGAKVKDTGICDDAVFAADYSRQSHFLVCLEMREYDYLRTSDHCYELPDENGINVRITDEKLRSVCWTPVCTQRQQPDSWFHLVHTNNNHPCLPGFVDGTHTCGPWVCSRNCHKTVECPQFNTDDIEWYLEKPTLVG